MAAAVGVAVAACSGGGEVGPDGGASDRGPIATEGGGAADGGPPVSWGWTELPRGEPRPVARGVHALAFDTDRRVVWLVGGQPAGSPLANGDAWAWDGSAWTEHTPLSTTLPERKNHGLAYDRGRARLVVFGGINGGLAAPQVLLGDTWEWDGSDWAIRAEGSPAPAPRAGHAMAYDERRGRVVVFGGSDGDRSFGDTWEWDGASWTEVAVPESPSPRLNTRMVYDRGREVVVLFGGQSLLGASFNDTWEYDGATWTERVSNRDPSAPPPRGFHAMAYDRTRGRTVLTGGTTGFPPYMDATNMYDDGWEWDGAVWASAEAGFGLRAGHAMAHDEARGRVVLFGGLRALGERVGLDDDTWTLGPVE